MLLLSDRVYKDEKNTVYCTLYEKDVQYSYSCRDFKYQGYGITIGIPVCINCKYHKDREDGNAK